MILNFKVIVVTTIFFNRKKREWEMKNTLLLQNNVISILDLFKILLYYIDDKKILEIRNKVLQSSFSKGFKEVTSAQLAKLRNLSVTFCVFT